MADFKPFDSANKVLITGAAGFIGFHLAKRLLTMGATILGWITLTIIMMFPERKPVGYSTPVPDIYFRQRGLG